MRPSELNKAKVAFHDLYLSILSKAIVNIFVEIYTCVSLYVFSVIQVRLKALIVERMYVCMPVSKV